MLPNFGLIGNSIGSFVLPPIMNLLNSFEEEDCLFTTIREWEEEVYKEKEDSKDYEERSILDAGTGAHSLKWFFNKMILIYFL